MRLNINLASRPYLDVRRILLRLGVPVLVLAICTAALLWAATVGWMHAREMDRKIAGVNSRIASLEHQQKQALGLLRLSKNHSTIETSRFLNGLIARKAFSWTRAFMQLEEILPHKLRVVSIAPHLQPATNTVQVTFSVAGSSRDAAVELVKRLEQSSSFRDSRIVEETAIQDRNSPDKVMFHLEAIYVATPAASASKRPGARAPAKAGAKPASSAFAAARESKP